MHSLRPIRRLEGHTAPHQTAARIDTERKINRKARLPQGYGGGGGQNLQQLARQAQKMQDQMEAATEELNAKEYTASAGGGMVTVTVSGELEIKKMEISPDVVDPDDIEMLQDLVTAAVNEAIRNANTDKEETMNSISGGMNLGGLGGLF